MNQPSHATRTYWPAQMPFGEAAQGAQSVQGGRGDQQRSGPLPTMQPSITKPLDPNAPSFVPRGLQAAGPTAPIQVPSSQGITGASSPTSPSPVSPHPMQVTPLPIQSPRGLHSIPVMASAHKGVLPAVCPVPVTPAPYPVSAALAYASVGMAPPGPVPGPVAGAVAGAGPVGVAGPGPVVGPSPVAPFVSGAKAVYKRAPVAPSPPKAALPTPMVKEESKLAQPTLQPTTSWAAKTRAAQDLEAEKPEPLASPVAIKKSQSLTKTTAPKLEQTRDRKGNQRDGGSRDKRTDTAEGKRSGQPRQRGSKQLEARDAVKGLSQTIPTQPKSIEEASPVVKPKTPVSPVVAVGNTTPPAGIPGKRWADITATAVTEKPKKILSQLESKPAADAPTTKDPKAGGTEQKPYLTRRAETKTKEPEPKPADTKPAETKPIETKPVQTKAFRSKIDEVDPVEAKPVEAKPVEAKAVEAKAVEVKPVEAKPTEVKTMPEELKAVDSKATEAEAPSDESKSKIESARTTEAKEKKSALDESKAEVQILSPREETSNEEKTPMKGSERKVVKKTVEEPGLVSIEAHKREVPVVLSSLDAPEFKSKSFEAIETESGAIVYRVEDLLSLESVCRKKPDDLHLPVEYLRGSDDSMGMMGGGGAQQNRNFSNRGRGGLGSDTFNLPSNLRKSGNKVDFGANESTWSSGGSKPRALGQSSRPQTSSAEDNVPFRRAAPRPAPVIEESAWQAEQTKVKAAGTNTHAMTLRKLRAQLNKMTPSTYKNIFESIRQIGINNPELAHDFVTLVFDKAITNHGYLDMYADLCTDLRNALEESEVFGEGEDKDFRRMLLWCCQEKFEENLANDFVYPEDVTDEEEKLELLLKHKHKMKGNLMFVACLGQRGHVSHKVLTMVLGNLLQSGKLLQLEALASFLPLCMESLSNTKMADQFDQIFERVEELSADDKVENRVQCLLKDALDKRRAYLEKQRMLQGSGKNFGKLLKSL